MKWGLLFTECQGNEVNTIIDLEFKTKKSALDTFGKIRNNFSVANGNCLVDLVDNHGDFIDDVSLNKIDIEKILNLLGH